MTFKIESIYDIGRYNGWREGEQKGDQKRLRTMLEQCITLRFPQMTQTTLNSILSIADSSILELIFKIACTPNQWIISKETSGELYR